MTKDALLQLIANVKVMLRERHYTSVLKYDRNQPRGPKGSRMGGKWVKGVSAGAHSAESFSPVPGMGKDRGPADYADILNAPSGTGFRNAPRQVGQVRADVSLAHAAATSGQREQEAQELAQAEQSRSHTLDLMTNAVALESRPLGGGGANASVVVTLEHSKAENEWQGTEAVYKPERGENWTADFTNGDISNYVTNRDFSLAAREAFAYQVGHELFGEDNPVPITVLREVVDESNIDIDVPEGGGYDGGGGLDSDDKRRLYESYREKRQEEVMDDVGQEMGDLFIEAQKEHVEDIEHRIEEMQDIWDEEREKFPADVTEYGSQSVLRRHPTLEMGPEGFERRADRGELDPLAILDEAGVDVSSKMSPGELRRVREVIQEKLQAGYREVAQEVDEDAAKDHLDYGEWLEGHGDTEMRLIDQKIKSFTAWQQSVGWGDSGGGGASNSDAPHPRGGSFQHFRESNDYGDIDTEDGARMAVLDYVIGTMDRHGGNLMYDEKTDRPVAIDNGYSMPASRTPDGFQFRSVAVDEWMGNSDLEVPENVRVEVSKRLETTNWQALLDRHPGMNALERKAFLGRVEIARRSLQTPEGLFNLWDRLQRI